MSESKKDLIRQAAEADLEKFIRLVHPLRVLGGVHSELIRWITSSKTASHKLVLLPRDHQKSAIAAYWVAWQITKNPAVRILYISSTANLATKQLKFIKDILTSDIYRFYWPEMVGPEEGKREKWTETEISVDHPLRKAENVRDPTVFTAGLTTTITGMHADKTVLDDVVVQENAYTADGRKKVEQQVSLLSSIEGAEAEQLVVGTRYHPKDLYNSQSDMKVYTYTEDGEETGYYHLYDKFERQVEINGEFLWPRQQRYDGKWFGFDRSILEKKRAQYLDKVQFRAQYYNDPNDQDAAGITSEFFQYYDKSFLIRQSGVWHYKGSRLNVFASIDFAFAVNKDADYTAIVVVGIDGNKNYYVLDIDRFRTGDISEYFKHILALHQKWDFRKIRAEVTVAQEVIVDDLKNNYIRPHGLALSVEKYRPTRIEGNKKERVQAILQPRYANLQVWHYESGNCQILEEELVMSNPAHDDVKDCLASAIEICVAPSAMRTALQRMSQFTSHPRFGGVQ